LPACCSTDPVQRDGLGFQVPRVWQPDGPAFAHILVLSISPFVLAPAAHSKHHCLQVVLPVFPAALLFDGQPQENMVEAPSQDALASGCDRQDVFHLHALRLVLLSSACRRGMCWRAGSWVLPWETLEPASGEKGTRDGTERRGTTQEKKLSQGGRVQINGFGKWRGYSSSTSSHTSGYLCFAGRSKEFFCSFVTAGGFFNHIFFL